MTARDPAEDIRIEVASRTDDGESLGARVTHTPTGVSVTALEQKSYHKNVSAALKELERGIERARRGHV